MIKMTENMDKSFGRDLLAEASSGHDSDVDSSKSVGSSSDTHSAKSTSTDKSSSTIILPTTLNTIATSECSNSSSPTANNGQQETTRKLSDILGFNVVNRSILLPWASGKERCHQLPTPEAGMRPGEFVMRIFFADFTIQAEKKIEAVMNEPEDKSICKTLQRGEDAQFDQLLSSLGSVAEHCLPSLLRTLFAWYERQMSEVAVIEQKKTDQKSKSIIYIVAGSAPEPVERSEVEIQQERRDAAVEFIFCLVLIEVLKQLPFHPGHEDLINYIENVAFKHFKYREGIQNSPNGGPGIVHIIADLYAEVIGVLAQSRFMSVRKRFMTELKELRSKEHNSQTSQSIISLLMGMKFFRVKMVPIEDFEASFQFMYECGQYFLEVKDKDIKHALAGLFVEILIPVAAAVKNEVNVPCLKMFVDKLYSSTLDASTKGKHRLAFFPLVTCLLCVSHKGFFLQTWHYFLAMCLSHLKHRDPKMRRVSLESLYRLLWVYMIRVRCESNTATQSRLQSIVNSLFPRGAKTVIPRDAPLNIFVKIIQFISQERLDFAMREIVFELLCVGRPIKFIMTPERMSVGLRAFLVVADSLQQKDGDPPMPRTIGVMPSGNTLRVRKTFLNKMLTADTAKSIGMSAYFFHVRRAFLDILRTLDLQYGRPLMMTNTQNLNKEPDEMITGERKPKIDLFRTCIAAIPRLIPDGMTGVELVELLSRLTVHMDEELRALAYQSLQTLLIDFPDWRQDVLWGFTQFLIRDVLDTFPSLVDNGLRMLLQLLTAWRNNLQSGKTTTSTEHNKSVLRDLCNSKKPDSQRSEPMHSVLHRIEAFAMVMLCNVRLPPRKSSVYILKELKTLIKLLNCSEDEEAVIDLFDKCCPQLIERCLPHLPTAEKPAASILCSVDLQWIAERSSPVWSCGNHDDPNNKNGSGFSLNFVDPWSICLFGFLEKDLCLKRCPTTTSHSWSIVFTRISSLFSVIDPTPVNDNRASILRSSATVKKPVLEREVFIHLWKNYITFAFRVIPSIPNPIIRCASPDLSLSSSPDSLSAERSDNKNPGANISPVALYKLIIPLLRCEVTDVRDTAVSALGKINIDAFKDLMEEFAIYIREAVDRKQENVRRRKRRDALRLQLVRVFELIAEYGTFGNSPCALDRDTQSIHQIFVEYMDGARLYLEGELDKNSVAVKEITLHFCKFIVNLIKSFNLEARQTLLKRELRKNLFSLFSIWAGKYSTLSRVQLEAEQSAKKCTDLQFAALQAMSYLLTCGPCFDAQGLAEDGYMYRWLDGILESSEEKVYNLGLETVILLLEFNPDVEHILDWVVDRCYTGTPAVAESCFLALATIFSAREYPCDHYIAVINVTLMSTGCPKPTIRDIALQLLQLLDKRFFGTKGPLSEAELAEGDGGRNTLDTLLAATYSRDQLHLSEQLAKLHPELTMPMFSEITHRFQTARPEIRQILLQYLLPWLHNMELVDPNVVPTNPLYYYQYNACHSAHSGGRKEGWGSAEATEMVLNNVYYITAKFSDNHPKEIEAVWASLCVSWPNNMKVIIRYLIIVSGMAPTELLPYAKRVVLYLSRVQPARLLDEMMFELQTVETLNCLIERTETPPFYRLTVMRKASSHLDGTGVAGGGADNNSRNELGIEKGTIHTKRHSGEDPLKLSSSSSKTDSTIKSISDFMSSRTSDKIRALMGQNLFEDISAQTVDNDIVYGDDLFSLNRLPMNSDKFDIPIPQPHPLPMPEYGGYFAPLTEYLPETCQPISGFHRCNVAVMLLCDVVVDGLDLDWSVHIPLMLHIIFLGLDHTRPIVYQHCKQLLLNLLIVLARHNDYLTVSHIILNSRTNSLGLGLCTPTLLLRQHTFTESDPSFDSYLLNMGQNILGVDTKNINKDVNAETTKSASTTSDQKIDSAVPPVIVTPEDNTSWKAADVNQSMTISEVIKSMIHFLATRPNQPLWIYEDITAKVWFVKSSEQIDIFLQHVLRIFRESLPNAHINERWAQTALQLGLSCSSRHYAGRSLQIFRSLRVPITSRMLSDILSRLVETVAEQGEDMQGYVTELLLTLEAAVDSLESDFRPLDFMKDFFKSTPNLNNKEPSNKRSIYGNIMQGDSISVSQANQAGHMRSTSYSVSYAHRKSSGSPASEGKDLRNRGNSEAEKTKFGSNLSRSRSAQSLKMLSDSATQDDKLTILAQLFWLAVSLLESDYEHEFLLALRLLARVLHRLPLDRPDARDKVEKLQAQLRWNSFPGVHSLLLKGCTHPNIYEPVVAILSQFTPLLDLSVVDPSQSIAFPMNVIALLPYMLLNYEDANELCIRSADNICQVSVEKSKKLENLGTVMNLYSRRTFSKESFQWTKCVIKYLHDTYAHLGINMLAFLLEVLEKGPSNLQIPILNIIHCVLHYVDLSSTSAYPISADLVKVISKYIEGVYWKEALKILKLVVTRSSTLGAPPAYTYWEGSSTSMPHSSFSDFDVFARKELPGRTMEFTFDVSQTPVVGRKQTIKSEGNSSKPVASPRRSCSLSPADSTPLSGWKRPWISQGKVRECLVNLLTACGQRVGLPKSPSVIFSQNSDLIERQSSMASSTEEVSGANNDFSGGSRREDTTTDFGVFKDFDFLEYESESIEGESTDNFNWGVKRQPALSDEEEDEFFFGPMEESLSDKSPNLTIRKGVITEESSDDEIGSESPLYEIATTADFENALSGTDSTFQPPTLEEECSRHDCSAKSDSSESTEEDLDITPCNASPSISSLNNIRPHVRNEAIDSWNLFVDTFTTTPANVVQLYRELHRLIRNISGSVITLTRDSSQSLLAASIDSPTIKLLMTRVNSLTDIITHRLLICHIIWFNLPSTNCSKLTETLRYGILEVQEHLETLAEKMTQTLMYSDALKTTFKLKSLSQEDDLPRNEDYLLEFSKSLYKLHFQLLLLVESANKLTVTLVNTLNSAQFKDVTTDIVLIKSSLVNAIEDTEADGGTPVSISSGASSHLAVSIEELEILLVELIKNEKWSSVIACTKQHYVQLCQDMDPTSVDDISLILNIYAKQTVEEKPDTYIITNQENDLADVFGRLFQVSAAVYDLENVVKERIRAETAAKENLPP